MARIFATIAALGLLIVSLAGNVVLYQQAASNHAEAVRLRDRLEVTLQEQVQLESRITDLRTENAQLRAASQAAAPSAAAPAPTSQPQAVASPQASPSVGAAPAAPGGGTVGTGTAGAASVPAAESGPDPTILRLIEEQVSRLRGLEPLTEVPLEVMNRTELRDYFVDSFEREYLPEDREIDQKLLVTLGLLQPDENLLDIFVDLLQEQVLGIYSMDEKTMYVIGDRPEFGGEEKLTYAHEFVHALQDQHFDLQTLSPKRPENEDRSMAIRAVTEGDAVLLQRLWLQNHLTQEEIEEILLGGGDSSKLEQAPRIVREELLFPYVDGFNFVRQIWQRAGGDYAAVDEIFRNPPDSTEQILHPEKYRTREQPIPVVLPNLAEVLGGDWRFLASNTLGEFDTRLLVEQYGERATASVAVAGWGGDRWQLIDLQDQPAVVFMTTWDTENDAREFFETYGAGLRERFGEAQVVESSEARLALTGPGAATELQRRGSDVLAVISFDRPSVEAIAGALSY